MIMSRLLVWMTETIMSVFSVWLVLSCYGDVSQALRLCGKWGRRVCQTSAQALQQSRPVLLDTWHVLPCVSPSHTHVLRTNTHPANGASLSWAWWGGQGTQVKGFQVLWRKIIQTPQLSNVAIADYCLVPEWKWDLVITESNVVADLMAAFDLLLITGNKHLHSILWFILFVFHNPVRKFENIIVCVLQMRKLRPQRLSDLPEAITVHSKTVT